MSPKYKQGGFGELGEMIDRIAWREAKVRGPYNVAEYIRTRTGGGPTGTSMSDYYYHKAHPPYHVMERFVKAFDFSQEESDELARVYAYRFRRDEE